LEVPKGRDTVVELLHDGQFFGEVPPPPSHFESFSSIPAEPSPPLIPPRAPSRPVGSATELRAPSPPSASSASPAAILVPPSPPPPCGDPSDDVMSKFPTTARQIQVLIEKAHPTLGTVAAAVMGANPLRRAASIVPRGGGWGDGGGTLPNAVAEPHESPVDKRISDSLKSWELSTLPASRGGGPGGGGGNGAELRELRDELARLRVDVAEQKSVLRHISGALERSMIIA
jgi:hypothetical protein